MSSSNFATERTEFDEFMANIPRDTINACGKTYSCKELDGKSFWSSDPKSAGASARTCNVDMLVAAAYANNCTMHRMSTPVHCNRHNPILKGGDGKTVQVRNDASYDIPSLVEAHWKCVSPKAVTQDTHDPSHVEDYSGLALLHLKEEEPATSSTSSTSSTAPDPSSTTFSGSSTSSTAPGPSSISFSGSSTSSTAPDPSGSNASNTTAPDPSGSALDNMSSVEALGMRDEETIVIPHIKQEWNVCSLRGGRHYRACNADADCPLTDTQLNEILLTRVRELNIDMSHGFSKFMKSLKNTMDVDWTQSRAKALEGFSTNEAGVKSSLKTMFQTDPTFKASIRDLVGTDPDFSLLRDNTRNGSCSLGRCMVSTVAPTSKIYDGTSEVQLSVVDGQIKYTRNGIVRDAEAIKCIGQHKQACDLISDVVEGNDSLSLTGKPVLPTYRVKFGTSEEYMVMNNVNVKNRSDCDARLCEHNAEQCPARMCKLTDDNKCISKTTLNVYENADVDVNPSVFA